ncbi:MAG: hypothetical protein LC642_04675 [Verrucomicrobiaceae bacterium]|nr:hypothetical protein [Verrucomicrobiaceae bacterium]
MAVGKSSCRKGCGFDHEHEHEHEQDGAERMSTLGYRELDESASAALTRFYNRTGWTMGWENGKQVPVTPAMSFDEAIAREDDGEDASTVGEYEIRQRMAGARGFIRFLQAKGPHPADMLKQLADACRTMHIEPFCIMTMDEQACLFGQGRAAVSFRGKVLSRELRLSGMHADKIPGQKSKAASESYRKRENAKKKSEVGGRRSEGRRPRSRQKSFLRQLHVQPSRKAPARQGSRSQARAEQGAGAKERNGRKAA